MIRGDGAQTPPTHTPRVTLTVEGTPMNFLVDTGAEHSVLKQPLGKLKNTKTIVIGATGQKQYLWSTLRTVDLRRGQMIHSFLVISDCPITLLETKLKDLSKKLDPIASGWPSYLKAIAAIALLIKDADKLTLGQQTLVVAPHTLESIIQQPTD